MRRPRYGVLRLVLFWWLLSGFGPVVAQPVPTAGVTCQIGTPAGARRYRPAYWALVEVYATNRTDQPAKAQAILRFLTDPTLQYGRHVTVPPHSTLRTTCPIRVPRPENPDTRHVEIVTDQVIPRKSDDAKRQTPYEKALGAQPMVLDRASVAVGMIVNLRELQFPKNTVEFYQSGLDVPPARHYPAYDMVLAAMRASDLTGRVSAFDPVDLPAGPACLDALDVLVLCDDRLAADPEGIEIVRNWVLGGGHLWITLDTVLPDTVAAVMGDSFSTTVVDRVRLTTVRIRNARVDRDYDREEDAEFEEPVELLRVIPEHANVTETIDGWPAAFWQPFGTGRVFFTTLGADGWMRPATRQDQTPGSVGEEIPFVAREPLEYIAADCLVLRQPAQLDIPSLQTFLSEQIGYRILSRGTVAAMLAALCLFLLVTGLWLFRHGRAERLIWIAPLAVVITSLAFLAIGFATKRSVPPTVATIVRVVLEPGVTTGHSYGLVAMYNRDACAGRLEATRGGIFFPDMTAMGGQHRRLIWTDEDAWHWEDLELPPGVRNAPLERCIPLTKTADCRVRFGARGLEGTVGPLSFTGLEDAIIAVPYQPVMVARIDGNGTLTSGLDDVLAPHEFMAETILGDRQRRRKAIYERLFQISPEIELSERPVLFAWTGASDTGFVFPQPVQVGATLLSIPLRIERSAPGEQVAIPAPFVPYRGVADLDGRPPAVYSNLVRNWTETKRSATQWVRFQLPRTVLPIRLSHATLSINVRAPSRSLEVLSLVDGKPVVITRLTHPIGTYQSVLDRREFLETDDQGGLLLAIRVSEDETPDREIEDEAESERIQSPWKIESLRIEVAGTVLGE